MSTSIVQVSKFLSYVLRHEPAAIGLVLDEAGWASITELIALSRATGKPLTRELIEHVVATNDKQRFAISGDGERIRANQGHSVAIELNLPVSRPPESLYHGTAERFLDSIRAQGLLRRRRQHVHLSRDVPTALRVGQRHGQPVVLEVRAAALFDTGRPFYLSDNGVWLTEAVPPQFLVFPAS
ncbi:MAG TPA: RNA 2'-phosphotransferase [Thermoanaerobaculia bacterium]|nr:RNA 2'-phosphotransferase [Thermoanaerobaculia bacterium]